MWRCQPEKRRRFHQKKRKKIRRTSAKKIEKQVQTLTGCGTEIKQRKEAKEEGVWAKEQRDGYLRWNIGVNHKGKHSGRRRRRRRRRRGTFSEGCSRFTRKYSVILELRLAWIFTRLTPLRRTVIHVMKVCSSFSFLLPPLHLLFLPIFFFFFFFLSLIDNWRESK